MVASPEALAPDAPADPRKAVQRAAFRRRLGTVEAPETFAEVGARIAEFLGPVTEAVAADRSLDRTWPPGGPWR